MSEKIKCKVFKVNAWEYAQDYRDIPTSHPLCVSDDWWELTKEEYDKLYNAIETSNKNYSRKQPYKFFAISQVDQNSPDAMEIYKSADEFIAKQEKEHKKLLASIQKRKDAQKKAVETRKRNQLEKLKKELGEG